MGIKKTAKPKPLETNTVKNIVLHQFETFRPFTNDLIGYKNANKPAAFNGFVRVVKYRITIERIEESQEVYAQRLNQLAAECDNWHNHLPIELAAQKHGVKITETFGSKIGRNH